MFASLRDRRSLEAAAPGRPGDGPCGGALQNMLLSRRDEIAVTMPRRRPNTPNSQNIFSLSDILPPFFPLCAAVCSQLFISPPSPSLCARVSNELVWFPFSCHGHIFLPISIILPYLPPSLTRYLVFFSQCLLSPPRTVQVAFFLSSSAFTILYIYIYIYICIPMVLENPTHIGFSAGVARVRPVWSSSVLKV